MGAICSSVGASFGGALAITTSSGPGIALKSEAMNLAMMLELPLVVIDVQRGGPSTGLPTKTEQSDLNMVMFGRNGESPLIVLAAATPSDCFEMAFEAARLTLEHMTPVVLLTDGYIANGSAPWKIPDVDSYPIIKTRFVDEKNFQNGEVYLPYERDEKSLVRTWAVPGMENLMHRVGGLEKEENTGNVSYDAENHEKMIHIRSEKVKLVANNIPLQTLEGDDAGDVLLVSWGGTYGATHQAVTNLRAQGKSVTLMHLKYINPMPKNIESILKGFQKIIVAELNGGQLKNLLNTNYSCMAESYTKMQGKPFMIRELEGMLLKNLEDLSKKN
jgi:2-oxoglutarate ferredoxin oxidoreductase subunit alpha